MSVPPSESIIVSALCVGNWNLKQVVASLLVWWNCITIVDAGKTHPHIISDHPTFFCVMEVACCKTFTVQWPTLRKLTAMSSDEEDADITDRVRPTAADMVCAKDISAF